ncbi:MAG: glycosyltransferase [Elusimicrobiota bacterium]
MVSAVLTNYNCSRFLPEAVRSVLAQTADAGEVLVADDGSTDGSRESVAGFGAAVEWLPLPHRGQAAALEDAIKACRGEWIAFLETDDVWDEGKLEAVLDCIGKEPGLAAVQHFMRQTDARLRPLPTRFPGPSRTWTLADFLEGRTCLCGMSALVARRDVLLSLLPLPKDLTTCVDEYLQPRLLAAGPMRHLARPLGGRRLHGGNFYGGLRRDPERLERYLGLRVTLDAHLEGFLAGRGLRLSSERERRDTEHRLELEFFLHRARGEWAKALAAARRLSALQGWTPRLMLKAASLALALASPGFYWRVREAYEGIVASGFAGGRG